MIVNVRHKGLKLLHEQADRSKLRPDIAAKAQWMLSVLDLAEKPEEADMPGMGLHPLKGDRKGWWSVSVSRNHRLIFRFAGGNVHDLELIDYH